MSANLWTEKNNQLVKKFEFKDFKSALEFVNKVGELAEKANHHPDIELSWGKVVVRLTSHDVGNKVTERDRGLALDIDAL